MRVTRETTRPGCWLEKKDFAVLLLKYHFKDRKARAYAKGVADIVVVDRIRNGKRVLPSNREKYPMHP